MGDKPDNIFRIKIPSHISNPLSLVQPPWRKNLHGALLRPSVLADTAKKRKKNQMISWRNAGGAEYDKLSMPETIKYHAYIELKHSLPLGKNYNESE